MTTLINNNRMISELVVDIQNGNQSAFEELYDKYSSALYGISLKILRDEQKAQDVLQESMINIWKKINFYDSKKGTIFTWMLNIVRNKSIDELRKIKKEGGGEIQPLSFDVYMASSGTKEHHIGVKDLLDCLPEEQKQIMEYLFFKGYTHQEVSDELDLPLGTVKSRSRIALRDLRKLFLLLFWI